MSFIEILRGFASPRSILVLDWIGTLLMLGSLWGWFYARISAPIRASLEASIHRHDVLLRFARMKYGFEFTKVQALQNTIQRNARIGIAPGVSFLSRIQLKYRQQRIRHRLEKFGLADESQKMNWLADRRESSEAGQIVFSYWYQTIILRSKIAVVRAIGLATHIIFQGSIAKLLFVFGFVMWNISKALSVWPISPT